MNKRKVIPGCDVEGSILEKARLRKKSEDSRYTQGYVAGLVGLEQGIWTQWKTGTTRILDVYWLTFSIELGFDPFKTRPELLEQWELVNRVRGSGSPQTGEARAHSTSTVTPANATEVFTATLAQLGLEGLEKFAATASKQASPKQAMNLAKIFLARAEEGL